MSQTQDAPEEAQAPKRYIVAARVSTEDQGKHGVSLSHQLDATRARVAELGGIVVDTCIESGLSGSLYEGRPDLQKALRAIEAGHAQGIVWYDLSRMSRDIEHIQVIQRRVARADGEIHFCTARYAAGADGFLHQGIEGVVAQHARLKTRESSMANRRKAVLEGRQTQRSVSPYGYKVISTFDVIRGTHTTEQLGTYEVIPEQAEIVRKIFELYAGGESLRGVCKYLQESGIPTPKGRRAGRRFAPDGSEMQGVQGTEWLASTIKSILSNSCHKGIATFGKTRNVHDESLLSQGYTQPFKREFLPPDQWLTLPCPAIVSEELWDACNARMGEAQKLFAGAPERKYMLTGLLRCPRCHRTMTAARRSQPYKHEQEKRIVYHCKWSSPSRSAARTQCLEKHFWGDELEAQVLAAVVGVTTQPQTLERAFAHYQTGLKKRFSDTEYSRLKRELSELEKRLQAAVTAQVEAMSKGVDASLYERILQESSARRQTLRENLARFDEGRARAQAPAKPAALKTRFFTQMAADVARALQSPTHSAPEKQKVLARLIESIYPAEDGSHAIVRIAFRPGLFEPGQRWIWRPDDTPDGEWEIQDTTV